MIPRGVVRGLCALLPFLAACGDDSTGPVFTPSGPCDAALDVASTSATEAARTMGICDGLVSARWVYPNGAAATTGGSFDIGHGLLTAFGAANMPREGAAVLALSTGTARMQGDPAYQDNLDKGYGVTVPAGFPNKEPTCPDPSTTGRDGIGLHVVLVAPVGVEALAFDFQFFTRDYPTYDCTTAIDQAAALFTGLHGAGAGVVSAMVDASGDEMFAAPTVLNACTASTGYACTLGTAPLAGTGMSASSGWVQSPVLPVSPGDTIRATFTIWDTLDGIIDSTVLIDNFRWIP